MHKKWGGGGYYDWVLPEMKAILGQDFLEHFRFVAKWRGVICPLSPQMLGFPYRQYYPLA